MLVFHCSTVKIEEFYIPLGGLHFGGIHSALRAGLTKLYKQRNKGNLISTLHIHECVLTPSTKENIILCNDMGSDEKWREYYEFISTQTPNTEVLKYKNKYEPDTVPSYCIFDVKYIKLIDSSSIHMDNAEDMLNARDS